MECHCLTWKDGWLCMRSESPLSSEPTTIVSYSPLVSCSRADVENRVTLGGRYRYLGDGAFRELDGDGKARTMHLKDGGATLPIATEQVPIQRPRCRVQTRWYNGRWEKYLAREGWVPA